MIGTEENSFLTLCEHTQSIENQNENKPIKIESNIITQWNVKCRTAQTRRKESVSVWCMCVCVSEQESERESRENDSVNKKMIIRKTTHNRITHVRARGFINVYESTHTQQRH